MQIFIKHLLKTMQTSAFTGSSSVRFKGRGAQSSVLFWAMRSMSPWNLFCPVRPFPPHLSDHWAQPKWYFWYNWTISKTSHRPSPQRYFYWWNFQTVHMLNEKKMIKVHDHIAWIIIPPLRIVSDYFCYKMELLL